jgi:hypothetical protein
MRFRFLNELLGSRTMPTWHKDIISLILWYDINKYEFNKQLPKYLPTVNKLLKSPQYET